MTTYRIRAWSETFLTDKTRGRAGSLRYVLMPVRLHDPDYRTLAARKDGAACLGVWLALVEAAGTLEARDGMLRRSDGRPLTVSELSAMTGLGESSLVSGISALTSVGWLVSETGGTIPNDSQTPPLQRSGVERSREEWSGEEEVSSAGADANAVLAHYRSYHERFKGGDKERKLIRARLADGWSVADLQAAIDGNHRSPFHRGENERGQQYHKLDLILRDSAHVQQFLDVPANGQASERMQKATRILGNWAGAEDQHGQG